MSFQIGDRVVSTTGDYEGVGTVVLVERTTTGVRWDEYDEYEDDFDGLDEDFHYVVTKRLTLQKLCKPKRKGLCKFLEETKEKYGV